MEQTEIIKEIQKLKEIQPRQEWVSLTETRILGESPKISPFVFFRPVLIGALSLGVLMGLFFISQNSLPGDSLYSLKRISEQSRGVFVSAEGRPEFQLKLTEKRLSELQEIVEKNDTRKLSSALSELSASKANTKKEISKAKDNPNLIERIAPMVKKNIETEKRILSSIGIENEEEKEPDGKLIAEYLIKNLEKTSLTEKQEIFLTEAKECFEQGNYQSALSKALEASQIQYK